MRGLMEFVTTHLPASAHVSLIADVPAIATRYDQLANGFLGMVHLATAKYGLKFVHAA